MKTIVLISTLGLISASPLMALDTNVLTDDKARLSYSIGVTLARQWKEQGVDVDPDVVLRGLKDEQEGMPLLMNQEELSATMTKVQQGIAARTQQRLAQIKEVSEAFLVTNKNNPGVISLPDGLQYKIITEGDGAIPADSDTVSLNFRGTFVDGSEFASGKSTPVPVGRNAIHGWDEALKLMKTGSKWQVFIPSELAYGQTGFAGHIPPNAALILDVELLSIQHPNPQTVPLPRPIPVPQPAPLSQPLTSDIIAVPSAEDLKQGKQPYTIKAEDVPKIQQELQHTN